MNPMTPLSFFARTPNAERDAPAPEGAHTSPHKSADALASAPQTQNQNQNQDEAPAAAAVTDAAPEPAGDAGVAKDRRAYEVARQRAKRPGDRRKARDQKAKRGPAAEAAPHAPRVRAPDGDVDGDVLEAAEAAKTGVDADADAGVGAAPVSPADTVPVRLADLVRDAEARQKEAGDSAFVLVPGVRAVVPLDDGDFPDVPAVDDWEHVESSGSSDEGVHSAKAPSYAQVLGAPKH